jgi:hypothetical protein
VLSVFECPFIPDQLAWHGELKDFWDWAGEDLWPQAGVPLKRFHVVFGWIVEQLGVLP